ncbi:hypothetical protein HK100_012180 [Physocladia obscura]|uniref:Uncharacterized protein n=1 Tax=Physocladia obscura TaxID=109957 RepID=A0AAD5T1V6_9FUNG|nr:hypothetical protein HK100_012180 [Physocladia obscura]
MRSSSRLSAPLRAFTSTANLFHSNPLNLGGVQTRIKSAPTDAQSLNPQIRRGVPIPKKIPNVKKVIAVYSAKGGVGKSTTSVNLATTLAYHNGLRVAILDADLFGPSIPRMMNLSGKEAVLTPDSNFLVPLTNHGVQCMSMGFLINEGQVVAWRGMMVMKAIEQLLWQVQWADVDVLVIDMPPGTGDTQISILQQVELDGVVIVSTPQDVALSDAKKGIALFNTRKVPILGLVENMSFFTCPNCSHESHIFNPPSKTGVSSRLDILAQSLGAEVIARVPLDPLVCEAADSGKLVASVDSKTKQVYVDLAQKVKALLFN